MVWDPPKQKVDVTRMIIYSFIPILGIYAAWRIQKFWILLVVEFVMSIVVGVTLVPLGMISPELISIVAFPLGILINILLVKYFAEKYNEKLDGSTSKKFDSKITNYIENDSNPIHTKTMDTNNHDISKTSKNPLWYLLPLLMGIVGGIIVFLILKNSNYSKAKHALVIGMIVSVPFFAWISIQIMYGSENPLYVIANEGMNPELKMYDVVTVNSHIQFKEIDIGDIIVFSPPSDHNQVRVSRVVSVIDDNPWTVRTQSDANPASIIGKDFPITEVEYLGKVVGSIPQIGYVTQNTMIPILFLVYFVIIFSYVAILYNTYRKSKNNIMGL